jgi:RNase P/RNase MRP subunit p29
LIAGGRRASLSVAGRVIDETRRALLLDERERGGRIEAPRRVLTATATPPKVLVLTTFDLDGYV